MADQLCYEDVEVGAQLPSLQKHPTTRQLVKWVGLSGEYNELHYDKDFANSMGFPGVVVQGRLKAAFLCQLITDWIGEKGIIKKLACRYLTVEFPGKDLFCKGKVIKKYVRDSQQLIECEIWTQGENGERSTIGSCLVILPSRSGVTQN